MMVINLDDPNMASNMWTTNNLFPTCNANGCGKFGDHPTPKNISICQYSKRWLLTLEFINLIEEFSLSIVNNTNYVGCDYEMCHFVCVKGVTFWHVIVIDLINQHICCDNQHENDMPHHF